MELHAALHDEVNRLPEKYRVPITLVYLEGLSQVEAADRLQWPVGTVSGRMARGRDMLRDRLTRRGLSLSSAAIGVFLAPDETLAAMPGTLVEGTFQAALRLARGSTLTGSVSPHAIALTQGVLTAMFEQVECRGLVVANTAPPGAGVLAQQVREQAHEDTNELRQRALQRVYPRRRARFNDCVSVDRPPSGSRQDD